jgi:hypothetical protein
MKFTSMKPITKNSSFIFILFLLVITCAKETEENNSDTNEEIFKDEKVSAKTAMADLQKFNTTAYNLLAITKTNLKSLQTKSKKTESEEERVALLDTYIQSRNEYNELKDRLKTENEVFKRELTTFNRQTELKYRKFKNSFYHDILELNNNLEDLIDEFQDN